jgi:hypothetical protein
MRAKYVEAVTSIDSRRAEVAKYDTKLKDDRIATLGAIQAVDQLIASITPPPAPEAAPAK